MVAADRPAAGAPAEPPSDRRVAPYAHALADAAFRDRVERRYQGTHDRLDALWWLQHPQEAGPSGTPSPDLTLRALRSSLYGRSPAEGAVARFAALEAAEAADSEALEAALREAEPLPVATAAAPQPPASEPVPQRRKRRWRRWAAASVAAALGALALAGWARGAGATAAAPDRVLLFETGAATGDALSVFSSGTTPRLGVLERRLALVGRTAVSASLTRGIVCLELQTGRSVAGTCRTVASFSRHGLELPFPTGSSEVGEVRWFPDGRLRLVEAR